MNSTIVVPTDPADLEVEVDTGADARIEKVMDSVLRLHKIRDHNPRHDSSLEQKDGEPKVRRAAASTHRTSPKADYVL